MTTEEAFRQWWQESYGVPPGPHAVMTHVAWAQHMMGQAPMPSAELVAEWSAAASDGGNATLSQSDERIAAMAIQWAWGQHAAS